MTDTTTSLVPVNSMRGEWRNFGTFLKRPRLPDTVRGIGPAGLAAVLRMFALDIAVMFALLMVAALVVAVGVELPRTALADMELDATLIVLAVVAAPIMEEVLFRGWLSGRPGHILSLVVLLAGFGALAASGGNGSVIGSALALAGFVGAILALVLLRKRPPFRFFERHLPVFFWLSTLAFALMHLFNFSAEVPLYALLPLVLPQFVLGAIAGYLRVTTGLWAAILLHMLHNGLAIGAVLLGTQAAG